MNLLIQKNIFGIYFFVTFPCIHLFTTVLPKIFWNLTTFQCWFEAKSKTGFDNYYKKLSIYELRNELQNVLRLRKL